MMQYGLRSRVAVILALFVSPHTGSATADGPRALDAFEANRLIGRGMNLGNALEAPNEGDWGLRLEAPYFETIRKAGFSSVRIPIKWSAYTGKHSPFTIHPRFFERVDWAVEQGLSNGLAVVIDVHHYEEMDVNPEGEVERLLAMWRQIATHYRDRSERLFFELLNEPHERLDIEHWNGIVPRLLATIRETNPTRTVIIGPAVWNGVENLPKLRLPAEDRHIIATFHYYKPMEFTHQGASWMKDAQKWLGTKWTASDRQVATLKHDLDIASAWSQTERRPVYLGEFGALSRADMSSRSQWTKAVAREAEARGFSWAYWEFGAGFGAYDRVRRCWEQPLLDVLIPKRDSD